ncbi:MAG TPA: peptidase S41, partial [Marinilabiliaceae bacterium]|nr:peptidase S41 [Marinilabiliaceae bacterium]
RDDLKRTFTDFEEFKSAFFVDEQLIEMLVDEGVGLGVEPVPAELELSSEMINNHLKALIAKDLWDMSAYYEIINPTLSVYNKAIELLEKRDLFSEIDKR